MSSNKENNAARQVSAANCEENCPLKIAVQRLIMHNSKLSNEIISYQAKFVDLQSKYIEALKQTVESTEKSERRVDSMQQELNLLKAKSNDLTAQRFVDNLVILNSDEGKVSKKNYIVKYDLYNRSPFFFILI